MPADPTQPVPGPTREQIRAALHDTWTDWDEYDPDKMADAVLALLPARPSPTDDASDIVAEYKAALTPTEPTAEQIAECDADRCGGGCIVCEGHGMPLFAPSDIRRLLAEIERLRAHQGTA